ncbi:MAG: hypothetical protein DWG77_04575 [Chloroflexi bacterium]|nr:hypothetical protein [Chloroflexota bacterium]MQC48354.1 hypothetical protein [Chloroflexota bacterium]
MPSLLNWRPADAILWRSLRRVAMLGGSMAVLQRIRALLSASPGGKGRVRIDQVAPWLYIGPALTVAHYRDLQARGVTHIVDLRAEASDPSTELEALGLRWCRLPVLDRAAPSDGQLQALIEWLDREADPSGEQALYIHCEAGLGRTPTIATALLMQHGLSLAEAHRLVSTARPESQPTAHQLVWLEALEDARGASL